MLGLIHRRNAIGNDVHAGASKLLASQIEAVEVGTIPASAEQ